MELAACKNVLDSVTRRRCLNYQSVRHISPRLLKHQRVVTTDGSVSNVSNDNSDGSALPGEYIIVNIVILDS